MLAVILPLMLGGCGRDSSAPAASPAAPSAETAKTSSSEAAVYDLSGARVDPFSGAERKAFVFIFVSTECPISNRYAPEFRRVAEEFDRAGVRFWLVYPDPDTTAAAIQKHLKEYQLPLDALRDPNHSLVRLSRIHVTPEAAVFLPGRRLVYHGRIDNRYVDLGSERPAATQRDLRDVLDAVIHGKPVPYATARAVGCYLSEEK